MAKYAETQLVVVDLTGFSPNIELRLISICPVMVFCLSAMDSDLLWCDKGAVLLHV